MQYTLTLNDQHNSIDSADELASHLKTIPQYDFVEIWLNEINGAALCVLVNRDKAFLMFLPDESGVSFTARDPNYSGIADVQVEFFLSNGQRDAYPAQWCVFINEAIQALYYFYENDQLSPLISWHKD